MSAHGVRVYTEDMYRCYAMGLATGLAIVALGGAGCGPVATGRLEREGQGVAIQRQAPVTDTGRPSAVLSLHQRTELTNGCRYGLTLSNNLAVDISDLPLVFTAYNENGVRLQAVTRAFFGIRPTQQQFAEITFQVGCERIKRIEVGDPGRCIVGELTRRSSEPGACLRLVDIPKSPLIDVAKEPS
jgi:hypothetical protein